MLQSKAVKMQGALQRVKALGAGHLQEPGSVVSMFCPGGHSDRSVLGEQPESIQVFAMRQPWQQTCHLLLGT